MISRLCKLIYALIQTGLGHVSYKRI